MIMGLLALLYVAVRPRAAAGLSTAAPAFRPDTSDYRALILSSAPLLDVRAPLEFSQGSLPGSLNCPILTDSERHLVGTCYKESGQEAAIVLGNELVCGSSRASRLESWTSFCRDNPTEGYLCCFRGGLRSATAQSWIEGETGTRYPLVEGGFKAVRRFLIDELERSLAPGSAELVVIGGRTGSGKTRAIQALGGIDLEGLARHRGSSFGRIPEDPEQPSQVAFENGVSIAFLRALAEYPSPGGRVYVEDEGGRIGNLHLPLPLRGRLGAADGVAVIEEGMESRLDVLVEDYVVDLGARFEALKGEERGKEEHAAYLREGLSRIQKKLGGARHAELAGTMETAFTEQRSTGDTSLHRVWLAALLSEYYDPMYDYQMERGGREVLFRGDREGVVEWAAAAAAESLERRTI